MSIVHLFVASIILCPVLIPKGRKKKGAIISILIMFILFGLEYEMTQDWAGYVKRFYGANDGPLQLESFYVFITSISRPIGFLGFLIVCAVFNLFVYYLYIKRYLPPNFIWLFFAIFMLRISLGFTFIDTNRQTLAISFILLSNYYHLNPPHALIKKWQRLILPTIFLIMAINTHTSAIIAIPILIIPYIITKIKNKNILYIFAVIFISSFIIDTSSISNKVAYLFNSENTNIQYFSAYTSEIRKRSFSIVEQGIYCILLYLLIENFHIFTTRQKVFVICSLIFISLEGYAVYTMARALYYYRIFLVFTIPILFYKILRLNCYRKYKELIYIFIAIIVLYCIYDYQKSIHNNLYNRWLDFKTIFDAPKWF